MRQRTPSERRAYSDGMLAGALRTRIFAEGEFVNDPRPAARAEGKVKAIVALLRETDENLKKARLEQLAVEVNTGLVDDAECQRRLDEIGATEDELAGLI